MNNKLISKVKLSAAMILTVLLLFSVSSQPVEAGSDIKVLIDGEVLEIDSAPIVQHGRVLVPFRAIFEKLGSTNIEWVPKHRMVKSVLYGKQVELRANFQTAHIDGQAYTLDVPAIIKNHRTLVPVRFVAEISDKNEVTWDAKNKEVHIITSNFDRLPRNEKNSILNSSINKTLELGESVSKVISRFGQPARKDLSEQGFTWYIYNEDLYNYFQVGIRDNKVVAFGSNSTNWEYDGFKIGRKSNKIRDFNVNRLEYEKDGYTVIVLSDKHEDNIVSTIFITDTKPYFRDAIYTDKVNKGLALQLHDLTNVYRLRNGLKPLKLDNKITDLAKFHCNDMAINRFFSHDSFNGDILFDRASRIVGTPFGIGENIAAGYFNSLEAANGLYKSIGHRENMLNHNFTHSGTAVKHGKTSPEKNLQRIMPYYTHNFQSK